MEKENSSSTPVTVCGLSPSCYCCYWRYILILVFIAIIFCFGDFFYLNFFYPKVPHFKVESLSLTNFTSSESVTGTWQVEILIINLNKNLAVNYYDTLNVTINYENASLSESMHMSFRQGSLPETTLNVTLSAVDIKVERFVLDSINKEREYGSIGFDVKVVVPIGFGFGSRKGNSLFTERRLRVLCSRVVVDISSNSSSGNLVGGTMDCKSTMKVF